MSRWFICRTASLRSCSAFSSWVKASSTLITSTGFGGVHVAAYVQVVVVGFDFLGVGYVCESVYVLEVVVGGCDFWLCAPGWSVFLDFSWRK